MCCTVALKKFSDSAELQENRHCLHILKKCRCITFTTILLQKFEASSRTKYCTNLYFN